MDKLTKDSIVTVDYESVELRPDGTTVASTEFYRAEFRVDSCAFGWYDDQRQFQCMFTRGEDETRRVLQRLADIQCRLICHNYQFELGVSKCRFPNVKLNWYADTMKLVSCYDNGGDKFQFEMVYTEATEDREEDAKKVFISGFSLVNACKRILNKPSHKEEAHAWLRANGVKKGKEGANLNRLPDDILQRYNEGDVKATLDLYEFLEADFLANDYDWSMDHRLFMSTVEHIVNTKIRGIKVDREQLAVSIAGLKKEIQDIETGFLTRFAAEIRQVEQKKLYELVKSKKSIKGKINVLRKLKTSDMYYHKNIRYNPGSNSQLCSLFVDVLKIQPEFYTAKGSPAFKSAHLSQWKEGGEMLKTRRKRMLVLQQCENLYLLSEYDGRWHSDLRAVGTATSRFAGGSHG